MKSCYPTDNKIKDANYIFRKTTVSRKKNIYIIKQKLISIILVSYQLYVMEFYKRLTEHHV